MRSVLAWIGLGISLMAGCVGPKVDEYRNEKPVLDLATYFNAKLDSGASCAIAPVKSSSASGSR